MKKQLITFSLLAVAAAITANTDVKQVSSLQLNVCVYDPDQVAAQSTEWRSMVAEIDKKYQKQFDAIEKEKSSLQTDVSKFQTKVSMMNDSAREAAQEDLMRRERDLKTNAEHVMQDYKVEREKLNMRFFKKLDEGMNSFKQAHNIDLALPKNPLVFASQRADQTNAIVSHMNKLYEQEKKLMVATAKKPAASPVKTA